MISHSFFYYFYSFSIYFHIFPYIAYILPIYCLYEEYKALFGYGSFKIVRGLSIYTLLGGSAGGRAGAPRGGGRAAIYICNIQAICRQYMEMNRKSMENQRKSMEKQWEMMDDDGK